MIPTYSVLLGYEYGTGNLSATQRASRAGGARAHACTPPLQLALATLSSTAGSEAYPGYYRVLRAMALLAEDNVVEALRSDATATLDALEAHASPIPRATALALAPALASAMATADEDQRSTIDRCALLLGRLLEEAAPEPAPVFGAAFSGDSGAAGLFGPRWLTDIIAADRPLTLQDGRSYACLWARECPAVARGYTAPSVAAGYTAWDWITQWVRTDPMFCQSRVSDQVPKQMITLLLQLLKSGELPELAIGGAWFAIYVCIQGGPALGSLAVDLGVMELAAEHCHAVGSPANMISISAGKAGRAFGVLVGSQAVTKSYSGKATRPDLDAFVAAGLFDICIEGIQAFAARGVSGLSDTHHNLVAFLLRGLNICRAQPNCEAKIRSAAGALAFCVDNDLDHIGEVSSTGSFAATLACGVFGRDDGGSEFVFTQQQVDMMIAFWSGVVAAKTASASKPSADNIAMLELCVSDDNKPLLLANDQCIPYLVNALLLVSAVAFLPHTLLLTLL